MKDDDSIELKFIRYLCGLALLPEYLIQEAANEIYTEWLFLYAGEEKLENLVSDNEKNIGDVVNLIKNEEHKNFTETNYGFLEFYDEYYEQQWLKKITANRFCVYNKDKRTNNQLESMHSKLSLYIPKKGSMVEFISEFSFNFFAQKLYIFYTLNQIFQYILTNVK